MTVFSSKITKKRSWEELKSGSIAELFGSMIETVQPTLDLAFFNDFKNDFVLEPVDYGYNLRLSLSREQYKEFKKTLILVEQWKRNRYGCIGQ